MTHILPVQQQKVVDKIKKTLKRI